MQETSKIDCDFSVDTSTHKDPHKVQGKKNGSYSVVTATPYDDGYLWRKYGEKRINGSPFTRSYYRCSYRDETGCQASRQVQQQSFSDPPLFLVTQKAEHTCNTVPAAQAHGYLVQHCQQPDELATPFLLQFNQSLNDDNGEKQPNYKSNNGGRIKEEEEACDDKNCTLLNRSTSTIADTDATFITSDSTFTESLPTILQEFDQFEAISLDDFLL